MCQPEEWVILGNDGLKTGDTEGWHLPFWEKLFDQYHLPGKVTVPDF